MRFLKHSFFVLEINIVCVMNIVIASLLAYEDIRFILAVPVFLGLLIATQISAEFIIISEKGIMCEKRRKLVWFCSWNEIQHLKVTHRLRNKAIDIIFKDTPKHPNQYYFQYGAAAKKALARYYKKPLF